MAIVWAVLLVAILYLLVRPIINGAFYFPLPQEVVRMVTQIAGVRPGEKVADLGSGDGRVLIAFAKTGAETHGYEINPLLVAWSRFLIKKMGLKEKAAVHWQSFWQENFSSFNLVVVYGYPKIMKKLGKKLVNDLKPGTKIISLVYGFPDWKPTDIKKVAGYTIYCYLKT